MADPVKIKICGLTNVEDTRLAGELGAAYAGFVFHRPSPRFVDVNTAASIIRSVRSAGRFPSGPILCVGVFVNEDIAVVRRIHAECGLDIVQLHGDETPDYCRAVGVPYWKALRIRNEASIGEMALYPGSVILVDAHREGRYGGTGLRIDSGLTRQALASRRRVVLAGGVSSDNLEEILTLHPYAVDVSSSLEERPGKKSAAKMKDFFRKFNEWRNRP